MLTIEQSIFRGLIKDEEYTRKVIPYLNKDYFEGTDKVILHVINNYITKYESQPSKETLFIELEKLPLNEDSYTKCVSTLEYITNNDIENPNTDWLVDETEQFCKDKSMFNSIQSAISIIDGSDTKHGTDHIPELMKQALSVCFDSDVGHEYMTDAEKRYAMYNEQEARIPHRVGVLDHITGGGLPRKTLNVVMGDTNVGKSLYMCAMASNYIKQGYNVLYISMEMSEAAVSERIDANLMDIEIDNMHKLDKEQFINRFNKVKEKTNGRFFVKQYPTAQAHAGHFRHYINELKLKKDFTPDVIIVDYINICASSRHSGSSGGSVNSYSYVKSIAEELRGLAVEFNSVMLSATQSNRSGGGGTLDLDLTNVSDSYGLAATVDSLIGLVSNEELLAQNMYLGLLLKNRYGDKGKFQGGFRLGVNYGKMRIYDPDDINQNPQHVGSRTPTSEEKELDQLNNLNQIHDNSINKEISTQEWVM